jgi:diguanylate cyclase (GGDEF)-like protein
MDPDEMNSPDKKWQAILDESVEVLNRHADDYNPMWASMSALTEAYRALLGQEEPLLRQIETQIQELNDLRKQHRLLADQVELLGQTDVLTGFLNYRRYREVLDHEWQRCMRSQAPLSLFMFDLDYFRAYNKKYGHVAGDLCLQRVGALLAEVFKRPSDVVARCGGEEFVCVAPETDYEGAQAVAMRVVSGVRELDIPHAESEVSEIVTISVGVATTIPANGTDPFVLAEAAESLVMKAKEAGRNQVQSAFLDQDPGQ